VYGVGSDKQVYVRPQPSWPWLAINGSCCATGIDVTGNASILAVRDTDSK
jgi:hypothetical protein